MKTTFKYCTDCNFKTEDLSYVGCPYCGKALKTCQTETEEIQTVGSDNSRQQASKVDIGMGAAVKGDVTSNTSTIDNSTSNVVNNVTNIFKEKSPAEIQEENIRTYTHRCRALCCDGLISKEAEKELETMQIDLGILPDKAKAILDDAKKRSKKLRTNLSMDGRIRIQQTINIINGNRQEALLNELKGLREWKQDYDVEELDQLYFQLFSILNPSQYVHELETGGDDEYWMAYWGVVAYNKVGQPSKAEVSHLGSWDSIYPIQNTLLIAAVSSLMQCDETSARVYFNAIQTGYSNSLEMVYRAVGELLSMNWDRELAILPATCQFYYEMLFKDYCDRCRRQAEERRQERMATQKQQEEERERERKEQIRRQQDIDAVNAEAERVEKQRQLEEERRRKAEAEAEKARAKANADKEERERLEAEQRAIMEERRQQRAEWWRRNRKWFIIVVLLGILVFVCFKIIDHHNSVIANEKEKEKQRQDSIAAAIKQREQDSIATVKRQSSYDNLVKVFEDFMKKPLNNVDENPRVLINGRNILCQLCDTLAKYPELSKNRDFVKEYNSRVDTAVEFVKNASHRYMVIDDSTENEWKNKINQIKEMYYNQ